MAEANKEPMQDRLKKIIEELLKEAFRHSPLTPRKVLRADGVTDGWNIGFFWKSSVAADLDLMIISEDDNDEQISEAIKAKINGKLPAWKKLESA